MRRAFLPLLRCPSCSGPLDIVGSGDPVVDGELVCSGAHGYPIRGGIPRFAGQAYTASFGYQWNRFATTQLDSANGNTESRDTFLTKTGFSLPELQGKRILDVGCGMGRFLEVTSDAGAKVVGVDLSSAVDAAYGNVGQRENVAILQADVFQLPFAPATFDYIYSIGVLHHTPHPRGAFLQLPRILKTGGRIAIWVYDRRTTRFVVSSVLRLITTRLPRPLLLRLCEIARPWGAFLLKVRPRWLRHLLQLVETVSLHPDPEWRVLDTFDWYSPRYQYKYGWEEVKGWFADARLSDIRELETPVAVTARRT